MQIALVAGGAGFIGSHLCKSLIKDEFRVICVDNLLTGDKDNLGEIISSPNFKFVQQDVTKPFELEERVDFIFHLASPASPNKNSPRSYINYPIETLMVNSVGTKNLLDIARKENAKFLFASTSEVYGDPLESPQKESYYGNVNPNGVRSVYDESKRFGEALVMAYFRKYNLDTRIIRIFNTYGPFMQADDGRVVSDFIVCAINNKPLSIYGDGKQTRSFCYVDDMVAGIKLAMFKDNTKGEIINLGNPDEKTILELASIIQKLAGSNSELKFEDLPQDDPKIRRPDISKAKNILGWQPKIKSEQGLTKTIEYFRNSRLI